MSGSSPPRRRVLKLLTVGLGGLVGAAMAVPVFKYVVFPARRRTVSGGDEPIPVARIQAVGAEPVRVEVVAPEQRDAWSKQEDVRIGAAWLLRDGTGEVRAFSTTCPHLGCSIDYDAVKGQFACPCHKSAFSLDGARLEGPAKRGMDPLATSQDKEGRVLVRFTRFKLDTPDREEV
jgi:menaquinol-cytochrome c reductase iron-sulfur subunit